VISMRAQKIRAFRTQKILGERVGRGNEKNVRKENGGPGQRKHEKYCARDKVSLSKTEGHRPERCKKADGGKVRQGVR